ncbi:MAG: VOC family protein [Actinobacteria bacterium]|nr:VOC family protein [Actinomycetota bacterium]
MHLLGLRTTIYPAPDLDAAKAWFTKMLGKDPYFDQPFYVGYEVGGYELGLDPNADPKLGVQSYWGVPDARTAVDELVALGATIVSDVNDTGEGIRVAQVEDPLGNLIGIIENPVFELPTDTDSPGPGR